MTTIYKFQFNDDCYIGSTNSPLKERVLEHYFCMGRKRCKNVRLYQYCNQYLLRRDFNKLVEVVEEFPIPLCRENRVKVEQKYIDEYKPTLNMRNAYGMKKRKKKDNNNNNI